MKRFLTLVIAVVLTAGAYAQTPKYVFYFIGDGMGANHTHLTNMYNKAVGLPQVNFTAFPVQALITTYSDNSLVTDSSAAGTALSSGVKIPNNWLGVAADSSWTTSIAELAQKKGFGTSVVTSVGVNHATPAAFYGHDASRNSYDVISQQLLDSKIDFAAGSRFLKQRGSALESEDWIAKAREAGINVFCGREQYKPVKGGRVIYLAADQKPDDLVYAVDRREGQTSLRDFTEAAIDYMWTNFSKKGFFLMIEGGMIDHAAHADDAVGVIHEVNDMAQSVQLALDFAAKHPNETLIIVTADHETGGLVMGSGMYEMRPQNYRFAKCSKDGLSAAIAQLRAGAKDRTVSWEEVKQLLSEKLGLWSELPVHPMVERRLTQAYKETFLDKADARERNLYSSNEKFAVEAIKVLDSIAMVSWSFGSHSGAPVMLWVYGAKASEFSNCHDNTDVPKTIARVARYN